MIENTIIIEIYFHSSILMDRIKVQDVTLRMHKTNLRSHELLLSLIMKLNLFWIFVQIFNNSEHKYWKIFHSLCSCISFLLCIKS